jgi:hypothetical protein
MRPVVLTWYSGLPLDITDFILLNFWGFNATFNNILAISWRPVLVVEEAEYQVRTIGRMGKQLENFIGLVVLPGYPCFLHH